jgi:hypothetical protein
VPLKVAELYYHPEIKRSDVRIEDFLGHFDKADVGVNRPAVPRETQCVWQRMCRTVNVVITQGRLMLLDGPSHICVNVNPICR